MNKNLPAIRYELFIKLFEKKVAAAQREIENVRQMEHVYNLVKEAMESARLPNDQDISIYSHWLTVRVTATPSDRLMAFDEVAKAIGERLHQAELHHDGEPSVGYGTYSCNVVYTWHGGSGVSLQIEVPDSGLLDLTVTKSIKTSESEVFKLTRIEPPAYAAPGTFKTVGDQRPAFAAEDEILF